MSEVIDRPVESTALTIVKEALPTIIAADTDDILGKLAKELAGFKPDVSTEAGRKEIASKARKAAVAKMDLIRLAGTLKADHQKVLKGIIAEEKIITERMDGLRDSIRAPLTEFEAREERRIRAHEEALAEIAGWSDVPVDATALTVAARLAELDSSPLLERDWEEFRERARDAIRTAVGYLRSHLEAAEKREAEAAELARLRAAEAERQAQEAARLQAEREAEIARQAAEAARVAAEAEAARKAREAEEAAQRADYHRRMLQHVKNCGYGFIDGQPQSIGILQRELTEKITFDEENFGDLLPEAIAARDEALKALQRSIDESNRRRAQEEAAEREREAAAEALARAERQRVEAHNAAVAANDRRIARHRTALAAIPEPEGYGATETSAEIGARLDWLLRQKPETFEEFAGAADAALTAEIERTRGLLVAARTREDEVAAEAEAERQAEAKRRETAVAEAAANAERERARLEQAAADAEAERRAANVAHRKRINNDALTDIVKAIGPSCEGEGATEIGKAIIAAIAKGEVQHVSIKY